jgi:hypothetical protein
MASAHNEVALPPGSLEPLAIGFAQGFVSDNPDLQMCGMAVMSEVGEFKQAKTDLVKGIRTLNVTLVEVSLKEFSAAIHDIPEAEAPCKRIVADIMALLHAFKKIHGPEDLIIQVLHHLFGDGELIFGEISAAEHAFKTGWDFMTAGQQLGEAIRRILIGELPPMTTPAPVPPSRHDVMHMAVGVAVGFVSDSPELLKCGADLAVEGGDFEQAVMDLKQGIMHLNMTDIKEAIQNIEAAVKEASVAKPDCKAAGEVAKADVKAIVEAIKKIHGIEGLIDNIVHNLFADGEIIFGELAAAEHAHRTKDAIGSGRQLGMALRRCLVGAAHPNSTATAAVTILV